MREIASSRETADVADLLVLLGRERAVDAIEEQRGQSVDRLQARAEIVAHRRPHAAPHLGGSVQTRGLLLELVVQREHRATRLGELCAHRGDIAVIKKPFDLDERALGEALASSVRPNGVPSRGDLMCEVERAQRLVNKMRTDGASASALDDLDRVLGELASRVKR